MIRAEISYPDARAETSLRTLETSLRTLETSLRTLETSLRTLETSLRTLETSLRIAARDVVFFATKIIKGHDAQQNYDIVELSEFTSGKSDSNFEA